MPSRLITNQTDFLALCEHIRHSPEVAFDTEFVSESYYRPRLCLIQLATEEQVFAVDPLEVTDLSAWWQIMTEGKVNVIVHGGREEIRFCLTHTGQPPAKFVDVQIAEGLLSHGYPIGYETLVQRVLGEQLPGGQSRTEWQRRPLSKPQLDYALEDVRHLLNVWKRQQVSLEKKGRRAWAEVEFLRLIQDEIKARQGELWRKIPGSGRLSRRELGILRELFLWRDAFAQRVNRPARVTFRDDLLIEVAKRRPKSLHDLNLTRGMQRNEYQKVADEILQAVQTGMQIPDEELPEKPPHLANEPRDEILTRILALALADRCSGLGISQSLVGSSADLHDIIRWHVHDGRGSELPRLLQGWRAEVCGEFLTDLLDGKISLRVIDPQKSQPLRFEKLPPKGS